MTPPVDSDRLRDTYRRVRPYLALVLVVVAAVLVYAGGAASAAWRELWVLGGLVAGAALVLGWRARQEQPGGWWAWLGVLGACELLLLVGAAAVAGLAGVQEGFIAALNSANAQIERLPGVLDRLDVAIPFGVAGAVAALGGIGVLVPLGRAPLPAHSRKILDEAVTLLLALVAAMSGCALLGVVAKTGPSPRQLAIRPHQQHPKTTRRQPPPPQRHVHRRVRRYPTRPRRPRLLPTQTGRRQTPQRRRNLRRPPTLQHHPGHAQNTNPLPTTPAPTRNPRKPTPSGLTTRQGHPPLPSETVYSCPFATVTPTRPLHGG